MTILMRKSVGKNERVIHDIQTRGKTSIMNTIMFCLFVQIIFIIAVADDIATISKLSPVRESVIWK